MIALIASLAIAASPDKFCGGFIQLNVSTANDPGSRLNQGQWGDVLEAMTKLQMNTVIIQRVAYREIVEGTPKDFDLLRPGEPDDALEAILAEAQMRKMTVFVGLWSEDLNELNLKKKGFFDEATAKSLALLKRIENYRKYLTYTSLGGWYLPLEPWNFTDKNGETALLRDGYLNPVSKACKDLLKKPVAISTHFTPTYLAPKDTTARYKDVLKDEAIDILMPQDGIGEKGHSAKDCTAYFQAYKDACGSKVQLWAILECFTLGVDGHRFPSRWQRLDGQFKNAHGIADSFVTYDFFHYMNPNRYDGPKGEIETLCAGGCAACRKCLYEGYRKLIGL